MNRIIYPKIKVFNSLSKPLVGGSIYTWDPGTEDHHDTYSDPGRTVKNQNPVILDAWGEATIYLAVTDECKLVAKDAAGNTMWTAENVIQPWKVSATASLDTFQAYDKRGNVLSAGKVHTFKAGTTTPEPTYTTAALDVENDNPVILDADGRADIFRANGLEDLKIILEDSTGRLIWSWEYFSSSGIVQPEKQSMALQLHAASAGVQELVGYQYFDNTYWSLYIVYGGSWDAVNLKWLAETPFFAPYLQPIGGWQAGFEPARVEITLDDIVPGGGPLEFAVTVYATGYSESQYDFISNGETFTFDLATVNANKTGDYTGMQVFARNNPDRDTFSITNIVFYGL